MQKVVIHKAGSYDRLQIESAADPIPGEGQVVVKTAAIGVNYADVVIRMGLYASAKEKVGWPITPGFEFAGTVSAVGPGVTDLKVGAKVFGLALFGAYATHVTVPRRTVFAMPENLSMAQAAGFPAVFFTAYFPLYEMLRLRKGMKVMIHSAAGGVGSAMVQLAKIAGCEVTGVVGARHKIEAARDLGADHVIDKSGEDLWARAEEIAPKGFDVILDANGPSTLKDSYHHLAPAGRLVIYGFHSMFPRQGGRPNYPKLAIDFFKTPRFNPLDLTNDNKSVLAFNLSYLFERDDLIQEGMTQLLAWLAEGKIKMSKVTEYKFDRVGDAHRDIESGQTVGKLVLTH